MVYPTATDLCFIRIVSTTSACPLTLPAHHWVGPAHGTSPAFHNGGEIGEHGWYGIGTVEGHSEWGAGGVEKTRVT